MWKPHLRCIVEFEENIDWVLYCFIYLLMKDGRVQLGDYGSCKCLLLKVSLLMVTKEAIYCGVRFTLVTVPLVRNTQIVINMFMMEQQGLLDTKLDILKNMLTSLLKLLCCTNLCENSLMKVRNFWNPGFTWGSDEFNSACLSVRPSVMPFFQDLLTQFWFSTWN